MTKDWESFQDEIRELSFTKKKSLEEVKEVMERKYKFRASTRAYRMKLKEWGLMRHKPRKALMSRNGSRATSEATFEADESNRRDLSETIEPTYVQHTSPMMLEKSGNWQVVSDVEPVEAEPAFMGLLQRTPRIEMTMDPCSQARTKASKIVMAMLDAILGNDPPKLESLIIENINHINDPIGMPFDTPNSQFYGHPAMSQVVILQHTDQTLLDIACAMPCNSIIWILLAHGAKGSRHPFGTDLALHNAIKNGRPYTVQAMLTPGRSDVNGFPGTKWKPLLQAVFWNHPEVVRILLRKGADLEVAGPSPNSPGLHTALDLCLERRSSVYMQEGMTERSNEILKILLEAGANIHAAPANGSMPTFFELFTRPWQMVPFWAANLSVVETDCLRIFVRGGANLEFQFSCCPCGSTRQHTFEHQALWHSTPNIARLIIDSFPGGNQNNGSSLLHEVLGSCPNSKRHPADTLRDIQVLVSQGVDPNLVDKNGISPLRKCIEQCPAVDLIERIKVLLNAGADPETQEGDNTRPFILAARILEGPLLFEAMQLLVGKMQGQYTTFTNYTSRTWSAKHFPIQETQAYEQVMSCSRNTGDFKLEMIDMVPVDICRTFERAYFAITSNNFLNTMASTAKARMLTPKDKDDISWIIAMRKGINLPDYKFDQELVVALLDPQPVLHISHDRRDTTSIIDGVDGTVKDTAPPPQPESTTENSASTSSRCVPWQFNPNNPTPSIRPLGSDSLPQTPGSATEEDFIPTTIFIRWKGACSTSKDDDLEKAFVSVARYECGTCNDGVPITKNEQEKHGVEHAHTSICNQTRCERRFCVLKKGKEKAGVGCQDHLFAGGI
ncbi:ankyrin repeat-containing domain protein [Phaeosphaeriaceae sp. PMI808]|nr:ankyrin repeat-containing domain protein [Phaeosphaeriaceae sp. PMI808]